MSGEDQGRFGRAWAAGPRWVRGPADMLHFSGYYTPSVVATDPLRDGPAWFTIRQGAPERRKASRACPMGPTFGAPKMGLTRTRGVEPMALTVGPRFRPSTVLPSALAILLGLGW